jgi:hypothetical protein
MAFFKFLGTLATIVATVLVVGFFLTMVPKDAPTPPTLTVQQRAAALPECAHPDPSTPKFNKLLCGPEEVAAQPCSTRDRHSATPTLDSLTCDPSR